MTTYTIRGSILDGLIRTAEQGDLLLYFTAAVGVFMPLCIYILYEYAHKLYSDYTRRRESRRREEEMERTTVTVFYAEQRKKIAELTYQIGSRLSYERPSIYNLADIDVAAFVKYKGIGLFIMDSTIDGCEPHNVDRFLEFLEDLAFDQKSISLPCSQMHFAVLCIGDQCSTHGRDNRVAKALAKRLSAIGAVSLYPLCCVYSRSIARLQKDVDAWASHIADILDRLETKLKKRSKSIWYYNSSDSNSTSSDEDKDEYCDFTEVEVQFEGIGFIKSSSELDNPIGN